MGRWLVDMEHMSSIVGNVIGSQASLEKYTGGKWQLRPLRTGYFFFQNITLFSDKIVMFVYEVFIKYNDYLVSVVDSGLVP